MSDDIGKDYDLKDNWDGRCITDDDPFTNNQMRVIQMYAETIARYEDRKTDKAVEGATNAAVALGTIEGMSELEIYMTLGAWHRRRAFGRLF
jgi:hypothetical protein